MKERGWGVGGSGESEASVVSCFLILVFSCFDLLSDDSVCMGVSVLDYVFLSASSVFLSGGCIDWCGGREWKRKVLFDQRRPCFVL